MTFSTDLSFASEKDRDQTFIDRRQKFKFPKRKGKEVVYLCGHSLGLQHEDTAKYILEELDHWSENGVEGHFLGDRPWLHYHSFLTDGLSKITGAKPIEVVAANSLTTNLHLMMVSFYRPSKERYKIVVEAGAFPSDRYAVLSQLRFHGYDESALVEVDMENEDSIFEILDSNDSIALILLGAVNYLTGRFFDAKAISQICKKKQIKLGLDLAHAIGNVPLSLHDWEIDFAVWCSYKYLNGGPGTVGGYFVHERHHQSELPRFEGWWGNDVKDRFLMKKEFNAAPTAEAWQLSNAPVISMASLLPSLELFSKVGIVALRTKSLELTSYLEFLLKTLFGERITIITSSEANKRGAQLSFQLENMTKALVDSLSEEGYMFDWRESENGGLVRVAPVPMYNGFVDIHQFVHSLYKKLK